MGLACVKALKTLVSAERRVQCLFNEPFCARTFRTFLQQLQVVFQIDLNLSNQISLISLKEFS